MTEVHSGLNSNLLTSIPTFQREVHMNIDAYVDIYKSVLNSHLAVFHCIELPQGISLTE